MRSLICLLCLLPAFLAAPLNQAELEKRFAPFSVAAFAEAQSALSKNGSSRANGLKLICNTLFCHLHNDETCNGLCEKLSELKMADKSVDFIIGLRYDAPTKNFPDCVERFIDLVGNKSLVEGLCHAAYKCKDHQLYEKNMIDFFNFQRQFQLQIYVDAFSKIVEKAGDRFAPFPVSRYIEEYLGFYRSLVYGNVTAKQLDDGGLDLACKALFCHLKDDAECNGNCESLSHGSLTKKVYETFTTADFGVATKNEADCVSRFTALKLSNPLVIESLCKSAYKCKDHQKYEQQYIAFAKYLKEDHKTAPTTNNRPTSTLAPATPVREFTPVLIGNATKFG